MSSEIEQHNLVGVWQRESLSIEKGQAFEDSNVLWLHAGDYYADLRWPKSGKASAEVSAFAGSAIWEPPRMQFAHEIDLTKIVNQDVATLSLLEGKLVEQGQISLEGKDIHFEEVWTCLVKADVESCQVVKMSEANRCGYIIRICDYAIAMQEADKQFSAGAWKYADNTWAMLFGLGDSGSLAKLLLLLTEDCVPAHWRVQI